MELVVTEAKVCPNDQTSQEAPNLHFKCVFLLTNLEEVNANEFFTIGLYRFEHRMAHSLSQNPKIQLKYVIVNAE